MRSANVAVEQPSPAFESAFGDLGIDFRGARGRRAARDAGCSAPQVEAADLAGRRPADGGGDQSKRILTIDDSKTMRDMLMLTLADAGFDVLQAVDGQDGVDLLGERMSISSSPTSTCRAWTATK